jgi:PAS domain S-box-containing protein
MVRSGEREQVLVMRRRAVIWLVTGLAYFGLARLSAHWGFVRDGVPLVALAQGVALSSVQLGGPWAAPALAAAGIGEGLAEGLSAGPSLLYGAAAAGAGLGGWAVVRMLRLPARGEGIVETLVRLTGASAVALVAATVGLSALAAAHDVRNAAETWAVLLLASFAGVIVVAPFIRAWVQRRSPGVAGAWERLAVVLLMAGVALLVATGEVGSAGSSAYLLFPVVVWAALRTGRMGMSACLLVTALIAAEATSSGHGVFVAKSDVDSAVTLDAFLVVLGLTGLLLVGLEHARRQTEVRHSRFLEQLPLVTYVRPLEGEAPPAYLDPKAVPLLGYPLERWLVEPRLALTIVHPDDLHLFEQLNATARQGELASAEYRMIASDGRVVWVLDHQAPIRNERGEQVGVQGFVLDISERKQLEAQLSRAQRVESLGLLAGGIAHDFNNLLTAIAGYSQLALEHGGKDDAQVAHDIGEVRAAADRAARLTRQLLAFGRRQVLEETVLDLNDVVRETQALLAHVIGETIEVRTELEPELVPVRADAGQLGQVVLNLAVNARDAMPGGGTLTIRTSNERLGGLEHAVLTVSDTGVGMSDAVRARIFEPFFTTKEVGEGTGLGLAVVDGIVQQSHGEISVSTGPGHGTEFRVALPRTTDEPAAVNGRAPAAPGGSETVLLVEDEEIVRRLTAEMLRRSGYRVVSAGGPDEALALDEPYDLLLTDVVMPSMSGPELAKRLAARRPDAGVLFISGYSARAVSDRSELEGEVLEKPFTLDELAAKVRTALDARRGR